MTPQEIYQSRAERFAARESEWSGWSYRLSNWRLTAFLSGLVFGIIASVGVQEPGWMAALFGLSIASFVVFAILVIKHRRVSREQNRFRLLKEINGFGVHRLNREWDKFPVPVAPAYLQQLPQARDLDLFGRASLFHLVSTQQTPQGRASLAHRLAESAPAGKLSERQEAVESLSPHIDWRQNLAVIGENLAVDEAVVIPRWFGKETWLCRHENLRQYLRFASWISLGSLLLFFIFSPLPLFILPLFILPFGFHAFLIRKHKLKIKRSLDDLAEEDRTIRCYAEIFDHLKECPSNSGLLSTLIPQVSEARSAMDQLNAIATWAAARGSLVHPLFNAFFALDLQTVGRLEKWQERYKDRLHGWFKALGEIETLASLASLHHDEPGWVRPEFRESGKLIASELGHPLVRQPDRVGNDVSLGPEGRFLLVTGSNMAGKSTLLRAIGLNTILARCGAPVCARSMITPPLTIATSMEIQDSLADGLSFFMAELKRIKEVVHLAIKERGEGRTLLFLFDEILQGTNSIERREIVQRVLANLVSNGAMGAVTTHDLALAESDELTRNADLIHFREHFEYNADGKPEMTFDYKIRPGMATTTNALKILEVIEMPV